MINSDKFIEEDLNKYMLMKYLEQRLDEIGLANVDIQRTPLVTRITLEVLNPAKIIGRRGRLINELTDSIKSDFGIENPQVSVVEIKVPFLEPRIVAKKATKYIELGKKVRSVLHFMISEIMKAGALGAEIVAAGKIGAKGARAKTFRISKGHIPKAGEPTRLVREAHINANTRSGVIGILVRLVPPGTVFPVPPVKKSKKREFVQAGEDLTETGEKVEEQEKKETQKKETEKEVKKETETEAKKEKQPSKKKEPAPKEETKKDQEEKSEVKKPAKKGRKSTKNDKE
ncbi:MAG TPA: 30S ribosomal protein S3 [Candidatus Bilamarchaeaceae archaeon]|nr:30S ribosomal protein S3 [Candidatus Bilamarchaeaceae archaeon]